MKQNMKVIHNNIQIFKVTFDVGALKKVNRYNASKMHSLSFVEIKIHAMLPLALYARRKLLKCSNHNSITHPKF